jgi:hypothetical protein
LFDAPRSGHRCSSRGLYHDIHTHKCKCAVQVTHLHRCLVLMAAFLVARLSRLAYSDHDQGPNRSTQHDYPREFCKACRKCRRQMHSCELAISDSQICFAISLVDIEADDEVGFTGGRGPISRLAAWHRSYHQRTGYPHRGCPSLPGKLATDSST